METGVDRLHRHFDPVQNGFGVAIVQLRRRKLEDPTASHGPILVGVDMTRDPGGQGAFFAAGEFVVAQRRLEKGIEFGCVHDDCIITMP